MRSISTATSLLAAVSVTILALAGCAEATPTSHDTKLSVVATTTVWGDIARQIGGDHIAVTSIISDPAQDPHSYEANAQVQLAVSKADLVIENGGGYDDFVGRLLSSASKGSTTVLNAVDISGFEQNDELNEHVWYDFPTVKKVAAKIVSALTKMDSSDASDFAANVKAFDGGIAVLETKEAAIKAGPHAGAGVVVTEPVPLYLLAACGLVNKTPSKFSHAIEVGTDVSPLVLKDAIALVHHHRVALLVYNEQTTGPETRQLRSEARSAGVPIIPVRETLPEGKHYLEWMTDTMNAVEAALNDA